MRRRAFLTGAASVAAIPAWAACAVGATVPLDLSTGPCLVTARLDGADVRMVLDTGAERTVVTRQAVARLGLALDPWVGTAMRGAGGRLDEHQNAVVRSLGLGGQALFQRAPGERLSLPVTSLDLGGLDGLIGGDVLRHHTLNLDFPAGTLALLPPQGCGPAGVPLTLLRRALPLAPVTLDGHAMTALIDTGAGVSLVNARGLFKLGLGESVLARDPAQQAAGIGGAFTGRRHAFAEFRLGSLRVVAPKLMTLAVAEPAFDLVVGLDLLGGRRMILSYGAATLSI